MSDISSLIETMTPEQRQALASALLRDAQTPASTTPESSPPTSSYYDMSEATAYTFKATLSPNEKCHDPSWAERFDHLWCKGNAPVKGPKGGVYFVGRAVLGVKKGQQIKGTLRVGNVHFQRLLQGGEMDAWFRPENQSESVLLGTLSEYHPV